MEWVPLTSPRLGDLNEKSLFYRLEGCSTTKYTFVTSLIVVVKTLFHVPPMKEEDNSIELMTKEETMAYYGDIKCKTTLHRKS